MSPTHVTVAHPVAATLATNKLIKNTYLLLSATLLFSAMMAAVGVALQLGPGASMICFLVSFGLLWLVLPRTANSPAGIGVVFAITGLLGLSLGPMLTYYLSMPRGPQIVATALGGTGLIFLSLSAYALTTRRDFSFMGGFLLTGLIVIFAAIIANLFLALPALSMAMSAGIILLFSGFILFDTSRMVHGGETNYVHATISLYLNVLNIFTSLLHLLGAPGGND